MNYGLIGKKNNKGLGTLSRGYQKYLPIEKFIDINEVSTQLEDFLEGLDLVIMLEQCNPRVIEGCRKRGIKTVLKVNYEFLPVEHKKPDLYLCSSTVNYKAVEGNKVLIPDPIDTSQIKQRTIRRAEVFVHNAGTLGLNGANCTEEVFTAIPLVQSDVKFLIRSQVPFGFPHPKAEVRIGDFPYEELWNEGDVFLLPQKFRATSLPIQEAMYAGMPVMTTDMEAFEFAQFLIEPYTLEADFLLRPVVSYRVKPEDIAKKIDEIAGKNIIRESADARKKGRGFSWEKLAPEYMRILREEI